MKKILFCILVCFFCVTAEVSSFHASINNIPAAIQKSMVGKSWNKGCPIALSRLAYLSMTYWGFDNKTHLGHMIINEDLEIEVIEIFRRLYYEKFPIHHMNIYSHYPISGYGKADDTVGFYCRPMDGSPKRFSKHSFGIAVDINPMENPAYEKNGAWPKGSQKQLNRRLVTKGMINTNGAVFHTFTKHGWIWGGLFVNGKDYMHFQKLMNAHYQATNLLIIPKNKQMPRLSVN